MDSTVAAEDRQQLQDQPLPAEVSLQTAGWFSRAGNYPVFSATWYRFRTLPLIYSLLVISVLLGVISLGARGDWRVYLVPLFALGFSGLVLCALGPWLAVLACRRGWPARREGWAVALAILFGMLFSSALSEGGSYLIKRALFGDDKVQLAVQVGGTATVNGLEPPAASNAKPAARQDTPVAGSFDPVLLGTLLGRGSVYLLVFWLGGGWHLITYFRQRGRLAQALQREALARAQAARHQAELKLSVLAAQVEPHFLFNTLAGVRSAISSDPERAAAIIDHLVDYLRATVPQLRSDGSSAQACLSAQLNAARAYLGLMRARIPRLSFSVEVEPGLAERSVPPLLLISLVENAVKHGIEPKIGPGHIEVRASRLELAGEPYLELCVSDDGVGFGGHTSGSGLGLSNIDERLRELYGKRASLSLKARPEGGVQAAIQLPLAP